MGGSKPQAGDVATLSIVPSSSRRPVLLITGGAGYIGSHAVLALRDAGESVVVIDDLSTGRRDAVPADVPLIVGDAGDTALLAQLFGAQDVEAVLHFAGSIQVGESVADPIKYYRNNVGTSLALVAAAMAAGVRHFLFSSTASVYGVPAEDPIPEDCLKAPINPYGASKLMVERLLADVAAVSPMNHGVLRYFNVAGADPAGRSGQSTPGATHLIKVALAAALGQRDGVDIFGDDYPTVDGTGIRDYIHVSDLAAAHVAALAALRAEPARSFTCNIGYGHGYSVNQVLDAVDRVTGACIARRVQPRRTGDPPTLVADVTRRRALLDWAPRFDDIDRIIADALAWERHLAESN
ncbi:MAG: UDP-glucose 4-epimerase GalE [Pseudomonadota bacterium]|jgi:UDP-glucose 4-epimerase